MPPPPTFHRPPLLGAKPLFVFVVLALALPLIAHAQTLYWDTNGDTAGSSDSSAIPEPSSVALCLGLCALAAGLVRRRMRQSARTSSRG